MRDATSSTDSRIGFRQHAGGRIWQRSPIPKHATGTCGGGTDNTMQYGVKGRGGNNRWNRVVGSGIPEGRYGAKWSTVRKLSWSLSTVTLWPGYTLSTRATGSAGEYGWVPQFRWSKAPNCRKPTLRETGDRFPRSRGKGRGTREDVVDLSLASVAWTTVSVQGGLHSSAAVVPPRVPGESENRAVVQSRLTQIDAFGVQQLHTACGKQRW